MYQKSTLNQVQGKNQKSNNGFTLIEVMIAGTILAISLTVIINLFSNCLMAGEDIRNYTIGLILAQSKMVQIKSGLETELSGIFEENEIEYQWIVETNETEFEGIEEIRLQIFWKGRKKGKSIDLIAYRNSRER